LLYDWLFQQALKNVGEFTADALSTPAREPMVEMPLGERNTFKMRTQRGDTTEVFALVIHVSVRRADVRNFERRYAQATFEIIDRVTMVLNASTTEERRETGFTVIKENVKMAINEVLGTPWVQRVFFSEIVHEIQ